MFDSESWSPPEMMSVLSNLGEFLANSTLSHPNVQSLMKQKTRFDAVVVEIFWVEALYGKWILSELKACKCLHSPDICICPGRSSVREVACPPQNLLGQVHIRAGQSHVWLKAGLVGTKNFLLKNLKIWIFFEKISKNPLSGLGAHFNCPLIALSTFSTSKWTNDLTKAPSPDSYVAHNFIKLSENMNFYERTLNTLTSQYENIFMEFFHYERQVRTDQAFGGFRRYPLQVWDSSIFCSWFQA